MLNHKKTIIKFFNLSFLKRIFNFLNLNLYRYFLENVCLTTGLKNMSLILTQNNTPLTRRKTVM